MSQSTEKALMRTKMKEERQAFLNRHGVIAANAFSTSAILFFDENITLPEGAVVGGYWPLQEEADCRPLMNHLLEKGVQCSLPCVEEHTNHLTFRSWRPHDRLMLCPLFPKTLRLMQPLPENTILVPDYLLIPILGFDRAGYRLGYGGGYYDRTLFSMRENKKTMAIGLGYACQEIEHLPKEPHDQLLDWVITERGMWRLSV